VGTSGKIWDVTTDAQPLVLDEAKGSIWLFTASGKHIISGDSEALVRVWDSNTGALLRTMRGSGRVSSLAVDPQSNRIAAGSNDGSLRLWDSETGRQLLLLNFGQEITSLQFATDCGALAVGTADGLVRIHRVS
jgi:WD40 repeat protein